MALHLLELVGVLLTALVVGVFWGPWLALTWSVSTLPPDWQRHRDRWVSFHLVRVVAGGAGLGCLVGAVVLPAG